MPLGTKSGLEWIKFLTKLSLLVFIFLFMYTTTAKVLPHAGAFVKFPNYKVRLHVFLLVYGTLLSIKKYGSTS